jgi:nucleoside-diphosphate-sugar epimerase
MRFFVTGGTGFIGGHVVRQLLAGGHDVVALVRHVARAGDLESAGAVLAEGDITDRESMREPMRGADGVFHIAAWYKVGAKDAKVAERINVEGTRNVLELMRELEIPKGVYTSTVAVFSDTGGNLVDESYRFHGKHLSEYDRTKYLAHYEVALPMIEKGLPLVIVMPGLIYGPSDHSSVRRSLVKYLQGKLPVVPKGAAYCWAHVEDTARGHVQAMEKGTPGQSYIIAGERHSFEEALKIAESITGIPAPKRRVSPGTLRFMSKIMGIIGTVITPPEEYHPETLRVIAGATYLGDNSKAKRVLGFDPRPLEEGFRETLHHEMKLLNIPIA